MSHRRSVLLLVVTSILWSFGGLFVKSIGWNSYAITCFRSLVALIVLLPFVGRPRLPRSWYGVLAMLCYTGLICTCIMATKRTTAANAILLQYTAPIYSLLAGHLLLRERIRRRDIVSIGALFLGMALFLSDGLAGGAMSGNLIALLSGVFYGLMGVFMRKDPSGRPLDNVFWGNLLAVLIMLPLIGKPVWTPTNLTLIVLMGAFQLALPYLLYSKAIHGVTALEITLITVLEPIMNPVWVFLSTGERPGPLALMGGVVVLGTVVLHELPLGRRTKPLN